MSENPKNQKCKCGHERKFHKGITNMCYSPKCSCMSFEQDESNKNNR